MQDYAACLSQISEESLRDALREHLAKRNFDLDVLLEERDSLDALDPQSRQIFMLVAGTWRGAGLERILRYLSGYGVPVSPVLFIVFKTSQGEQILIRETAASEAVKVASGKWQTNPMEKILDAAEEGGCVDIFDVLKQLAEELGLQARPWKRKLMFAPPSDGRRCLFRIHAVPINGQLKVNVETSAFSEFFPVTENQAAEALGFSGRRSLDLSAANELADKLRKLPISDSDNNQMKTKEDGDAEVSMGRSLIPAWGRSAFTGNQVILRTI